jgi:phage baseplate assembly protein W
MAIKDFSILLEKVNVTSAKKDIGLVSGFNAYSQYIENVCKTQKGELISNMNMGSNYFNFIFNGQADTGSLENAMAAYIQAAIPALSKVKVNLQYADLNSFQFLITYSLSNGISNQSNATTFIEVQL